MGNNKEKVEEWCGTCVHKNVCKYKESFADGIEYLDGCTSDMEEVFYVDMGCIEYSEDEVDGEDSEDSENGDEVDVRIDEN